MVKILIKNAAGYLEACWINGNPDNPNTLDFSSDMGRVKDGGDEKYSVKDIGLDYHYHYGPKPIKVPASVDSFQKKTLLWSVCGVENEENEGYLFDGEERFWETDDGKWAVSDQHVESLTL